MRSFTTSLVLSVVLTALTACGGGGGTEPPVQTDPPPKEGKMVDVTIKTQFGQAHILAENNKAAKTNTETLPVTSAGSIFATPVNQVISLNLTEDGHYYGGSDESGTYLIDPANVEKICGSSFQVGLAINGSVSRACGVPDLENNQVTLPGTCSKDVMFYTWHLKDGKLLWFDLTSERMFTIDPNGLPGVVLANGGQINWDNYQGATVKVSQPIAGTANIKLDFGSNCAGGFGKEDEVGVGHLVDLDISDLANKPLAFDWNANNAGADGGPGWGAAPWSDDNGNSVAPSAYRAYPGFAEDTGNFFVEFAGMPCESAGSITVYRGAKQDDGSFLYDPGFDANGQNPFGLGWLAIQGNADEYQIWTLLQDADVTASFDRVNFQLTYSCN